MQKVLFGELLGRHVRISGHDIAEILEDQSASGRRFGEIALSWGLCQPQHVWQAWWDQLDTKTACIDLDIVGVDSQALAFVPSDLATQFNVIPVRTYRDQLVVATSEPSLARASLELPRRVNKRLKFVLADAQQIAKALRTYYPAVIATRAEAD